MDGSQCNPLLRGLTSTRTRRGALLGLFGAAMGVLGVTEAEAKNHKKKKHKKAKPPQSPPPPPPPQTVPVTRTVRAEVTQTFSSPTPVTIPAQGNAVPYPSVITVSGLTNGIITDVNLVLVGFTHSAPDDLDVLLVGPTPSLNAIVMSDVGDDESPDNITMTLDDDAAIQLNNDDGVDDYQTGSFRPANGPGADAWPGAPTPSGNVELRVFNGSNPNGAWQLFVVDGAAGDSGAFADGWSLEITAIVDKQITEVVPV